MSKKKILKAFEALVGPYMMTYMMLQKLTPHLCIILHQTIYYLHVMFAALSELCRLAVRWVWRRVAHIRIRS